MATSAADPAAAQPYVVEDCPGLLQLLSDGTVVRFGPPPFPTVDDGRVEWKNDVYDTDRGLGVRMYKPAAAGAGSEEHTTSKKKLPVVVHFHGGGFCVGSYAWPSFHAGCVRLAAELPAVVLSFDYRLAPEHRVPAAYEDAAAALLWLRCQLASNVNPWLADAADARRVFVSGEATGGNLAHHLALTAPGLDIAGLILVTPAFLSEQPTRSELDTPATAFLTRELCDALCRLFLPAGADKDHPLINPLGPESPSLEPLLDVAVLVVAAEGDLLRDKTVEFAERLRALAAAAGKGKEEDYVQVELVVFQGEEHGFFGLKPASAAAGELVRLIARFVARSSVVGQPDDLVVEP
ncbi:probable carboxylesterase 15 [Brachypodium distachyon]|uniref:Alpha/beta hydrolase fold-3 domain-containing protein n=1 Tax=Brachypodium distachyon TaxID=15368 RepID=I1I367_BRADI|nr:probable carboxylesterase 15 [Brachypodium distachyon]KQJ96241.1 hypothetical protein BRADI_3g21747v3 [Brachypodium distachyon]|eukprot:XP_003573773.1 probable carboxylesterase 15 [Brachypodium distachyon]